MKAIRRDGGGTGVRDSGLVKTWRAAVLAVGLVCVGGGANAQWVAYHDMGATTGYASTGNITTHQSGGSTEGALALSTSVKNLIRYSDGTDTGARFSIANGTGTVLFDARRPDYYKPPADGTPAYPLFNVAGLNLDNGAIYTALGESVILTLTNLNPSARYDLAFWCDRQSSAQSASRITLGGAVAAINSSSTGIVDTFAAEFSKLGMQLTQPTTTSCGGTISDRGFGGVATTCCANL